MKNLRISASITGVLGFLSVIALILLLLALSDIADQETNLTLEYYISGISILILSAFTISTFVTLALLKSNVLFNDRKMTLAKDKNN